MLNIAEIKDLMAQFDASSLRQFSYKNASDELSFSKSDAVSQPASAPQAAPAAEAVRTQIQEEAVISETKPDSPAVSPLPKEEIAAEGDVVESPLVGVAYLSPAPDKPAFVSVGDSVKKGQTLLIIEAMKVMNEVPAPKDGVITEILVDNEEVIEFGKGLVRIK